MLGGGQRKEQGGRALDSHWHPHPAGAGEQPLSRPLTVFRTSVSFLLTTDLRMLTRGLGMGLEGLFSKLSGSVEE